MTVMALVSIVAGLVALVIGAEWLVKGASAIATGLGVQPIVVGLTVVAFGTSAPELAVSVSSALSGSAGLALGNVVGSNIANVLLILGASALVQPLIVAQRVVRLDVPIVIAVSVAVVLMALNGWIGRFDGILLLLGAAAYLTWLARASGNESPAVVAEYEESVEQVEGGAARQRLLVQIAWAIAGLIGLVLGSRLLVNGASEVARDLGVSDLVIGLTVVAVGTSLPELVTSMLAAYRGQRDIAVGNVIGSNLMNLLVVLGVTGVIASPGIEVSDATLRLDLPVMLLVAVVLVPIFWNGFRISRWEGGLLVAFYAVYLAHVAFDSTGHGAAAMTTLVALVAVPVALVAFSVTGYQGWRRHRNGSPAGDIASAPATSPDLREVPGDAP